MLELLTEIEHRTEAIVAGTRERMGALLDAVMAVSSGVDLDVTLRQIVHAAMDLLDARYGALGCWARVGCLSSSFTPVSTTRPEIRSARCRRATGCSVW